MRPNLQMKRHRHQLHDDIHQSVQLWLVCRRRANREGPGTCFVFLGVCLISWTRSGGPNSLRPASTSVRASVDSWRISSVSLDHD